MTLGCQKVRIDSTQDWGTDAESVTYSLPVVLWRQHPSHKSSLIASFGDTFAAGAAPNIAVFFKKKSIVSRVLTPIYGGKTAFPRMAKP